MRLMVLFIVLILITRCSQQGIIPAEIDKLIRPSYFLNEMQANLENGMVDNISPECLLQLGLLETSLAVQMIDATGKLPSGILEGNIDLGSFDGCLKIKSDISKIIGKYCLSDINITLGKSVTQSVIKRNFGDLNILNAAPRKDETSIMQIKHGFCVPHLCSANDLSTVVALSTLNISFSEKNCQTANTFGKLDTKAIIFISFCGIILMIVLISTLYDTYYFYMDRDSPHLILTTFSVLTNGKKLLRTSKNPDVISCLHGIRALSIIWVIFGHTYSTRASFPIKNLGDVLEWMNNVKNMYILGATISVDSFFLVSGLALTYSYLMYTHKGKKFNLLLFYVHRYLRLTPALAVAILFNVSLLRYFGSGPLWPIGTTPFENSCKENWWKALLYIQNYGSTMQLCLGQSWYLSVDTQLYLLSPIILLPLSMWPKLALLGTGLLTILSILSCFLIGWFYELNGLIFANLDAESSSNYFRFYYIATHTRAAVWLIGVFYGYVLFKAKNSSSKLSMHKGLIFISWIISLAVVCICLYGGHDLQDQTADNFNKFENSIYLALVRPSWGIALGWIIFMCFIGYGGPVNWLLSLPVFEIIAKLSYSMYLVHVSVMVVYIGQLRTPAVFSDLNMMYEFWGHFGYTMIVSLLLYLGIEYPIARLELHLLGQRKDNVKKQSDENNQKNTNDFKQP